MRKFLLLINLLFCLTSCQTKQEINITGFIKIKPEDSSLYLTNFFDSFNLIKFTGAYLSNINDIIDIGNQYVVLSRGENSDVHIFDKEGIFVKSPVMRGRASNESINISHITFDKESKNLYLLDFNTKLIEYSTIDMQIIDVIELPLSVVSVERLDNDRFVLYNEYKTNEVADSKVYVYNYKTKKIESKYLPIDETVSEFASYHQRNNLYKKDNNVIFYSFLENKGYKINKDSMSMYFEFDGENYELDSKLLRKKYRNPQEFQATCMAENKIWLISNCFEYGDKIFSLFRMGIKDVYMNVANIQTRESNSFKDIYDDILLESTVSLSTYQIISSDESGVYCAFDYDKHRDDLEFKQEELSINTDYNNPIVVLFK